MGAGVLRRREHWGVARGAREGRLAARARGRVGDAQLHAAIHWRPPRHWMGGVRDRALDRADEVERSRQGRRLVSDFTDPGELVCDPFAGSGTTAVACKRLGRSFIGWEKDATFHAAALKRIEAAREQFQLPRFPKAKQQRLLP
jgi:hypothetical protein